MPGAEPSRTPDDSAPRPGVTAQTGPSPRPGATAPPTPAASRPGRQRPTPAGRAATPKPDGAAATTATSVPPTPAAPAPAPGRPTPADPSGGGAPAGGDPAPAVELEPTTGAPVDAVPRRVPVRQHSRWHRGARRADGDAPPDGDDGTYWAPIEQVHWDGTPVREDSAPERDRGSGTARRRTPVRTTPPPDPLPGLAVLVLLSLVAAFFAWVSAGPFWLAVGHARVGAVVIDDCTGGGLTQRCRGIFTADDGRFLAHGVRVGGVPAGRDVPGTVLPARMAGPDGGTAYVDSGAARHLRWLPGLLVVLGCAAGIARWTGATRLPGRRNRRWAVAVAVAGPVLITLGFLAAAW
ncbi:hypothetical protein GA0070607_1861 [Micromonospora coriariae]|uniref:Uncharacterized protein n=1 Tax=Micromonospora coriariae TaxID=285665 RepID=A0A1C4VAP7_9ACTN|nr:hypothetical protein GA0070607_1861 [Micromonospora coriariae]